MDMPHPTRSVIFLFAALIAPASGYAGGPTRHDDVTQSSHIGVIALTSSLKPLRREFNAASGDVRLVYIVTAACRACLRSNAGSAVPAMPTSATHIHVFVVYTELPDAGARAATATAPPITGTHVFRYRDKTGTFARRYGEALGYQVTTADVAMIYGREQRWTGRLPPKPDFWMHQLPDASRINDSNGIELSRRVALYLAKLKAAPSQSTHSNESGTRVAH